MMENSDVGRIALSRNQRRLMDLVRTSQPILRSAITDRIDLTQQSVHRLIGQLTELNLIKTRAARPTGPGKPSPEVLLNPGAAFALGVLVNTDSLVLSLADLCGAMVAEERVAMDMERRGRALPAVRDRARALLARSGVARERLCGVGFTMPGYFVGPGAFNAPEPLRDWSLVDLRGELEALFEAEVHVENSATAGAIGEALNGAGQQFRSFAYLGFDYGFGGGIILDGSPLTGAHGNAGELSTVFTGPGESADRPALNSLVQSLRARGIAVAGIADLRQRFDPAWPGVAEWVDRVVPQLQRVVLALHGFVDPEAIVFGGQIAPDLADLLIERVRFPEAYRYGAGPVQPALVRGTAPGDPAATGAALKALKARFFL